MTAKYYYLQQYFILEYMPNRKNRFQDFENFQTARQRCFRSFIKKYEDKNDSEEALQKALDVAKINKKTLKLTSKHYKGLVGEIIFFGKKYELFSLSPLVEIGDTHADFCSRSTAQLYDVTTNIDFKDINDYIANDSDDLMIANVDIQSEEIEMIPTLFEHCPECGSTLHFIYSLSDEFISESFIGFQYPSQDLNKTCASCDYIEEASDSLYYIHSPHECLEEIFGTTDEEHPEVKDYLSRQYTSIANLGRKHFDCFISAVTRPEMEMGPSKHDINTVDRTKWIHPILDMNKNPNRKIYFDKDITYFYDTYM
jgi:hypothetical protein